MMFMLSIFAMAVAAGILGVIVGLTVGIEAERKRSPLIQQKDEVPCAD